MAVADIASGALPEDVHRSQLAAPSSQARSAPPSNGTTFCSTASSPARFRQAVLPEIRPAGRRAGGVLDLCHRLHRAPVRAAIFGHFGDRVGRKAVLITTLLITGFATFAVGLVPTYDMIGIWGAVVLTAIRFIQGNDFDEVRRRWFPLERVPCMTAIRILFAVFSQKKFRWHSTCRKFRLTSLRIRRLVELLDDPS